MMGISVTKQNRKYQDWWLNFNRAIRRNGPNYRSELDAGLKEYGAIFEFGVLRFKNTKMCTAFLLRWS